MIFEKVVAKSRDLFRQVLSPAAADDIIGWVNEMERHSDISTLTRLLRKRATV